MSNEYRRGVEDACAALHEHSVRHGIVHAVQPTHAEKFIRGKLLPDREPHYFHLGATLEDDGFITVHPKL